MVTISESSVALLVDVMWEVLPSSSGASEVLLDQIIKDQELYSLRQVSGTHSNHEQFFFFGKARFSLPESKPIPLFGH